MIGKPYSGKLNVRFDEGELETVNRYRSRQMRASKGPEAAPARRQLSTLPKGPPVGLGVFENWKRMIGYSVLGRST